MNLSPVSLPHQGPALDAEVGSLLLALRRRRERRNLSLPQIVALLLYDPEDCAALSVTATEVVAS